MSIEYNNTLIKKFVESNKYIICPSGNIYTQKNNTKVGYIRHNGYRYIDFKNKFGTYTSLAVHRIIWYVYGDSPLSTELVINHKDGNKLNNCINNLEQVTQTENAIHKFKVLKMPAVIGNSKLTKVLADEIRKLHNSGWTYKMLMNKYNVGKTTISYVINNKIWK